MPLTGRIFSIQRFSIHDGPGIRTTAFLKGCSLRCIWCHNPEGFDLAPSLFFRQTFCTGCGACVSSCPNGVHTITPQGEHLMDRARCSGCERCVRTCPAGALEVSGRDMTVEQVMDEVRKDTVFYRQSGGGLTLSGGEPLMQPRFAAELLHRARGKGIHSVVQTSCACSWESLDAVRRDVDLFLCDIKTLDPVRHRELTGAGNETILANVRKLHDAGASVHLRFPLVAGCNADAEDLNRAAALVASLPCVKAVEVLPYHSFGNSKCRHLGLVEFPDSAEVDEDVCARWRDRLRPACPAS